MAKELIERKDVKEEDTWRLEDMYATKADWEKDLKEIEEFGNKIADFEGKLADSPENLLKMLDLSMKMGEKIDLAFNYAQRLNDEDTANTEHQSMAAKVFSLYSGIAAKTAFTDPEIIGISNEKMDEFYKKEPKLEFYRRHLEVIRRAKDHTLSPEMEKLLAETAEMARTASETYEILDDANMTFPEMEDENGETVRITTGRFISFLESENRRVRKDAFEKYYSSYKQFANTYASLYNGQCKQQLFYSKARKYKGNMEAAVDANEVSPLVYRTLIDVVDKNVDKLHRYVSLRKKLLKLDELHMYDIYTPIIPGVAKKYTFEEAEALCLKALEPMGEDYVKLIKEGFDNRWIDKYENKGKRGGAYSAGAYSTHPYVLMNFNGTLDNVFTLIHEMGHSIHSYLSNQNQPFAYAGYKIFVAEVASTCNEVLLLEYLLKNTTDKKEKAYLLNHYLDMFKGTLYRQTQFAEFELKTNEMVEAGESLNADNLSDLYKEINEKYYGPSMISDEEIRYEWARIPHFYYDFYVYQYATSFAASVYIAHEILDKGDEVVKKYKKFLSSGCIKPPVDLLRDMGVDLETEKPVQDALNVMSGVLDEIEKLV